ncbi:MAG: XTP/dITP diphosphatase [Woeseiaceae bacterium]
MNKIVMASGNLGKLREIARLLANLDCSIVPQSDFAISEAEESGDTFVANALIKARHAAELTGLPAIADDSGLAVDALHGRPGVYSARYAGADASDAANVDKLLHELQDVPDEKRTATFHCVACFVHPDGREPLIAEGAWRGSIARERRGDGGFGYDPVFVDPELGVCSAELSAEQKNARSHRGKALSKLARQLQEL